MCEAGTRTMTFLPIVQRELRVAARRRGAYWSRLGAAIAALGVGAWILLVGGGQNKEIGPTLFVCLAALVFLYTAVGAQLTCDCLSIEKREGTLGLLFLTDLRGYDVVFGKLAATSLNAFYGMLAVLPVLAIPLLLGAVGMGEFCRVALVAVNLLFFFLSVGIFASSVCRQDQRASGLSALLVLLLMLGVPFLLSYCAYRQYHIRFESIWTLCPAYDCFLAFDDSQRTGRTTFQKNPGLFWLNVAFTQAYSWLFLLLACRITPRSWQDRSDGANAGAGWRESWRRLLQESPESRAAQRRHLLEINPFLWRVARGRFKRTAVWLFLAAAAASWFWMRKPFSNGFWDNGADIFCVVAVHTVLKFWLASEACRYLAQDRRSGSIELLLSTPLTEAQIIRGQFLGLRRLFGWPVAAVLLADLIFLAIALRHPGSDEDYRTWIGVYLICGAFLVMDLIAIGWLSIWLGLSGRKPNRAAALAFCAIVVLPGAIFFVAAPLLSILTRLDIGLPGLLACWSALGVATNGLFTVYARNKLLRHFRDTVGRGLGTAPPAPGRIPASQPAMPSVRTVSDQV
jgi:ABC-type transport system involved in multi-copper enzyme maturation permease subunit